MLSILCVRRTIKVKVGIPESFKVGWYPPKKIGSSHLKGSRSSKTIPYKAVLTYLAHPYMGLSPPPKTSRATWQANMDLDDECQVIHELSVVKC